MSNKNTGASQTLLVKVCPTCGGTGFLGGTGYDVCTDCGGLRVIEEPKKLVQVSCSECNESFYCDPIKVVRATCPFCRSTHIKIEQQEPR